MKDTKKVLKMKSKILDQSFKNRIHQLIPGGCHTYSKGDDQFPENAPAAIQYGKGAWVWDINNIKYLDCSMGLGSVTIGHSHKEILKDVIKQLGLGVNFQRPAEIELEAAEEFLSIVPMHDMIKFAKNGSAVTTAAVKLARAFTNRDLVAFPYDHPFYSYDDWFISKTPCNRGIPKAYQDLSLTFKGCNIKSLEELFIKHPKKIACVIMEPEKFNCGSSCGCNDNNETFLKKAINLCHSNGTLVVFDEMVSGFKTGFPGTTSKYNLKPDLATWGKGIANGFSCSALTGRKEIMNLASILNVGAEKVFLISTTHGAETHSLAALISTIRLYKKHNIVEKIHEIGKLVLSKTKEIILELEMSDYISQSNSYWTPVWLFNGPKENSNHSAYRTYFLQEMISNGVLFQGALVPSYSHGKKEISLFLDAFKKSVIRYKDVIEKNNIEKKLIGRPIKPVFRKYI